MWNIEKGGRSLVQLWKSAFPVFCAVIEFSGVGSDGEAFGQRQPRVQTASEPLKKTVRIGQVARKGLDRKELQRSVYEPRPELLGGEADGCGLIPEVHFWGPSARAPRLTSHTGYSCRGSAHTASMCSVNPFLMTPAHTDLTYTS
uniref:Uncharacterized protein n=1 Tax=Molossus molossus TaxID=27622 RepID=A0A7J8JXI4_MOLMO|nr:hypothetical protein HJG59_008070 [Molossus molossus]